jgi:hypothetical protein
MGSFIKMPPQIFRLVLLLIGIVASYSTARYFLTPPSFRQYGWYRGEALTELRERDRVYAGKKGCEECHSDEYVKLNKGSHKTLSCEVCHGAGQAHVDDSKKENIDKSGFAACLRCHEANPSRPKWHKQIVTKDHYGAGKCTECHVPHSPAEVP